MLFSLVCVEPECELEISLQMYQNVYTNKYKGERSVQNNLTTRRRFLKSAADELFAGLGLDTSTAIRIFLTMSVEIGGLLFQVKNPNLSLRQATDDV